MLALAPSLGVLVLALGVLSLALSPRLALGVLALALLLDLGGSAPRLPTCWGWGELTPRCLVGRLLDVAYLLISLAQYAVLMGHKARRSCTLPVPFSMPLFFPALLPLLAACLILWLFVGECVYDEEPV